MIDFIHFCLNNERNNYFLTTQSDLQLTLTEGIPGPSIRIADWKCHMEDCEAAFDNRYDLDEHIATLHQEKEMIVVEERKSKVSLKCDECNANFASKNSLNYHMAAVHEGKKPFKCRICNAAFTSKQGMEGHIAAIHEGKKPHHCAICLTDFSKKSNLKGKKFMSNKNIFQTMVFLELTVITMPAKESKFRGKSEIV